MKRLLSLLLLLVLLPFPVLAGEEDSPTEKLLQSARDLETDYEYRRAEAIYSRILEGDELRFEALLGLARTATGVGEQQRAEACYARAARLRPGRPEPARGMAHLALRLDRRKPAREWYERALALDPADGPSLAGLARLAIEEGHFEEARRLLDRAEREAPRSLFVVAARAEHFFRTMDMTASARTLRKLLEISPKSLGAHQRLANGFLENGREPYRPPDAPPPYDSEIERGVAAYRGLDHATAERIFSALDTDEAPDGRPAFFRGIAAIRGGRPREAIPHLWRALEREPGSLLFRNALCVAYQMKIASQRAEYGGGADGIDRLSPIAARLPDGEVPGIEKVVRGYDRLLPVEQAVVRRAVRPLASYLPGLIRNRVTHDILGLEERVCDAKERRYLETRRTMDGRWYGGLRGLGGRNAATGLEDILAADALRHSTLAHEFMHQVHRYGLTPAQQKVVSQLYRRAMAHDRCLDYYASTNEREYLAQGYEAFVSLVKSPYQYHLRRHDRAELNARDPALYRFLLRITATPDPDPALRPLAEEIVAFYEWVGDEIAYARARDLFTPLLQPEATSTGR